MRFQEFGDDLVFALVLILKRFDGFSQLGLGISVFALQGGGPVLEELRLPLVEKCGLDLQLVAEVGNADAVNQVASENGHLLISRVVLAGLSHGAVSCRFVV